MTVPSSVASAQQVSKFQSGDFYAPTPTIPGKVAHIMPDNPVTNVDLSKISKSPCFPVGENRFLR
ncbi:protein of unknown function [Paenibacillus alvei]|uniref:Uncharacterized protein n=1 Tax=Paenibacillus alvei TaxID=44250 RepID=A0A383R7U0_PAEAL|nr:protein of unknown function [Paenibacillus alvei]